MGAVTACMAFEGALAALLHRGRTGEGQKVEVNTLDAITTLQMQELSVFKAGHKPQERTAAPDLAATISVSAPFAAETARRNLQAADNIALKQAVAYERDLWAFCFATEDRTAFDEMRAPVFKHR